MAWPPPVPGVLLQLPVGFNTLSCRLPPYPTQPYPTCHVTCHAVSSVRVRAPPPTRCLAPQPCRPLACGSNPMHVCHSALPLPTPRAPQPPTPPTYRSSLSGRRSSTSSTHLPLLPDNHAAGGAAGHSGASPAASLRPPHVHVPPHAHPITTSLLPLLQPAEGGAGAAEQQGQSQGQGGGADEGPGQGGLQGRGSPSEQGEASTAEAGQARGWLRRVSEGSAGWLGGWGEPEFAGKSLRVRVVAASSPGLINDGTGEEEGGGGGGAGAGADADAGLGTGGTSGSGGREVGADDPGSLGGRLSASGPAGPHPEARVSEGHGRGWLGSWPGGSMSSLGSLASPGSAELVDGPHASPAPTSAAAAPPGAPHQPPLPPHPPSLPSSARTSAHGGSVARPGPSGTLGAGPPAHSPVIIRRLSVGLGDPGGGGAGPAGAFHDADVFSPFAGQLDKLWALWEMVGAGARGARGRAGAGGRRVAALAPKCIARCQRLWPWSPPAPAPSPQLRAAPVPKLLTSPALPPLAVQVLLGKPLMVVGPSPADCSWAVAALLSLIAPLPYAHDYRCAGQGARLPPARRAAHSQVHCMVMRWQ